MILPFVLIALLSLFSSTAIAQSGTVLDLGGGISTFNDSSGRSGTIVDLGGGLKSYSDNRGVTGTILDFGGGMQTFSLMAPPKPADLTPTCVTCHGRQQCQPVPALLSLPPGAAHHGPGTGSQPGCQSCTLL